MGSKAKKRLVFKVKRDLGRRKLLARSSTGQHSSPLFISLGIHVFLGLAGFAYWFVAENQGRIPPAPLDMPVALSDPHEKMQIPEAPRHRGPQIVVSQNRPLFLSEEPPRPERSAARLDAVDARSPRLIYRPPLANPGCCADHSAACLIDLSLDARGLVREARVVGSSGCPGFDAAALEVGRGSVYQAQRASRSLRVAIRAD